MNDPDSLLVLNRKGEVLTPNSSRSALLEGVGGDEASGSSVPVSSKLRSPVADWVHSLLLPEESRRFGFPDSFHRCFTDFCAQSHHPSFGTDVWFYVIKNGLARPVQVTLPERMQGIVTQLGSEGHQVAMISDGGMILVHSELAELRAEANAVLDAAEILSRSDDLRPNGAPDELISMLAEVVYKHTRVLVLAQARARGVLPPAMGRQQMLPRQSSRFAQKKPSGCSIL